jgi:hypothetical protein
MAIAQPMRPRRGALLPTVLAVMVIIGLSASAALFMARQERAASRNVRFETAVVGAADEAQVIAIREMSAPAVRLGYGQSLRQRIALPTPGLEADARLIRLGETEFALAIDARARDTRGIVARRRVSLILGLDLPDLGFPAALSLAEAGSAPEGVADGADRAPDGWPCTRAASDAPAVDHPSSRPSDAVAIQDLRERAAIRLAPSASVLAPGPVVLEGQCATLDPRNWGDPARSGPCGSHFPIVHTAGDLSIIGGAGQGVLVVDGDLMVSGGFEFLGAVIVAGDLRIGPGGALLSGGVRATNVIDVGSGGGPSIVRSRCVLDKALVSTAAMRPVSHRSWAVER